MDQSLNTLKVLLWKHTVVRIRRFIHTAVEFIAPLIVIIILFSIRGLLQDKPSSMGAYNETVYRTVS